MPTPTRTLSLVALLPLLFFAMGSSGGCGPQNRNRSDSSSTGSQCAQAGGQCYLPPGKTCQSMNGSAGDSSLSCDPSGSSAVVPGPVCCLGTVVDATGGDGGTVCPDLACAPDRCPNGYKVDANGCPTCQCASDGDGGTACPALACDPYCPNGVLTDANGCPTCECAPAPACQTDADCAPGESCETIACPPPCTSGNCPMIPAGCTTADAGKTIQACVPGSTCGDTVPACDCPKGEVSTTTTDANGCPTCACEPAPGLCFSNSDCASGEQCVDCAPPPCAAGETCPPVPAACADAAPGEGACEPPTPPPPPASCGDGSAVTCMVPANFSCPAPLVAAVIDHCEHCVDPATCEPECSTDADCPSGATCVEKTYDPCPCDPSTGQACCEIASTNYHVCQAAPTCTSDADCQNGQSCLPDPSDPCNQPGFECFRAGRTTCQTACLKDSDCAPDQRCFGAYVPPAGTMPPDREGTCVAADFCQTATDCQSLAPAQSCTGTWSCESNACVWQCAS